MVTRRFAVICALVGSADADVHVHPSRTEQLRVELLAGGLEDVVVVPHDRNDRFIIRGLAPAQSKDAARDLVEGQIADATIDMIILEPGVWVDDGVRAG